MRISDWSSDVCSSDLKGAQGGQRQVGARHRVDAAVGAVLALAGTEDDGAGQRRPAAHRMDDGGTGEVGEADLREPAAAPGPGALDRSEEHTSELQSLMRISYAVFCLKKKKPKIHI